MLLKLVWILIMFGGKYHQENAKNGVSESLDFEIFWGSIPSDPPASQLPRLSEKSAYGPDTMMLFNEKEKCQCRIAYIVL